jgi:TPR repeat protein
VNTGRYEEAVEAFQNGQHDLARRLLEIAPESDGRAWRMLGQMASGGHGEPADPAKAAALYFRAAELGDGEAAYNLGAMFAIGRGVERDLAASLAWYQRAAGLGDLDAVMNVGAMYATGEGVPVNLDEAQRWWRVAAAKGHVPAMLHLGRVHAVDRPDPVEAAHWFLEAAKHGNREAAESTVALVEPLRRMAERGSTRARTLLGVILMAHGGDPVGAVPLLNQSAAEGDVVAKRTLGYLLEHGQGANRDLGLAMRLYREAADGGDEIAAFNLGVLYGAGHQEVPVDLPESTHFLRLAAEAGVEMAYPVLGDRLAALGEHPEALRWYLLAAEGGDPKSMYVAGCWYRDGVGCDRDLVQSVRWFLTMLNVGSGDGLHEVHPLVARMDEQQVHQAARLARRPSAAAALLAVRNG